MGRVLVLGLVLSLENNLHICLQQPCGFSLAPAGFTHLRQRGEMPQSHSPPHKIHFPARTPSFSPLLGRASTSPSSLEAQLWKPAKLPASRRGTGLWRGAEPTKHLLEHHCRALSAKQQVHKALPPRSYAVRKVTSSGVTRHPWLRATGSAGSWEGEWVCGESLCAGIVPLVHRAHCSYSVPLHCSTQRQLCWGAGWTLVQGISGLGCLPLPLTAEQREVKQCPPRPVLCPTSPPGSRAPMSGRAASSRGAVPTALLHPPGFGICDCSNDLLQ